MGKVFVLDLNIIIYLSFQNFDKKKYNSLTCKREGEERPLVPSSGHFN